VITPEYACPKIPLFKLYLAEKNHYTFCMLGNKNNERDRKMAETVERHGFRQIEIAGTGTPR
jgi:hypothetical protein